MELTDRRAEPAVYFGGKSRIIDFALSNAMNSGIRRIAVATQYKAHSLIRHLQMGWNSKTRNATSGLPRTTAIVGSRPVWSV
jgi:ADP-glucose pyrophosphorylase